MDTFRPEQVDPAIMAEVEADLAAQLQALRGEIERLTHQHQRALLMKEIYGLDPLTRERFLGLQTDIDQYPGKLAELREEERLLTRWLDRSREVRRARSAGRA